MKNEIKVLSVEKKKKNYLVITDEDEFIVDEETLLKYQIFKDRTFKEEDFKKIFEEIEINKYFNKALKFLSYKSRSVNEVREYLKDVNNKEVIIKRLEQLGYLDDEAYAKNMFEYCIRNYKGPNVLKSKLEEKGVSKELVIKYTDMFDYCLEKELIESVIKKYQEKESTKPVKALKLSLLTKFYHDGFNPEIAKQILGKVEFVDNSYETLQKDYQKQVNKYKNKEISEYEKKQRIISYLMNKGYDYKKIKELVE